MIAYVGADDYPTYIILVPTSVPTYFKLLKLNSQTFKDISQ